MAGKGGRQENVSLSRAGRWFESYRLQPGRLAIPSSSVDGVEAVVAGKRSNHASFVGRAKAFSRTSIEAAALRHSNHTTAASETGRFERVKAPPLPDWCTANRSCGAGLMPM